MITYRMHDYLLGGKDNFAIDRDTAEHALDLVPEMLDYARGNRQLGHRPQWRHRPAHGLGRAAR
jgi:S-adenosyl methyltransferase